MNFCQGVVWTGEGFPRHGCATAPLRLIQTRAHRIRSGSDGLQGAGPFGVLVERLPELTGICRSGPGGRKQRLRLAGLRLYGNDDGRSPAFSGRAGRHTRYSCFTCRRTRQMRCQTFPTLMME